MQILSPSFSGFSTCPVQILFLKSYLLEILSKSVVFGTSVLDVLLISYVSGASHPLCNGAIRNIINVVWQ